MRSNSQSAPGAITPPKKMGPILFESAPHSVWEFTARLLLRPINAQSSNYVNLPAEFVEAVAQFPPVLRQLIDAELAVGNSIAELGYSFPAPPVGAYIQLAHRVSTRERASSAGLTFYERNSSHYCGEFTDERRFYFVLEPANVPEPEADMGAIRKALESKSHVSEDRAPHSAGVAAASRINQTSTASTATPRAKPRGAEPVTAQHALIVSDTATGWTRMLHFRDERVPYAVQFALERALLSLFVAAMDNGRLCLRTTARVVGARYDLELRLEAALPLVNCYSLRVEASWAGQSDANADYYRQTSVSWFNLWTRDLVAANAPDADEGSAERYGKLAAAAFEAQSALDSVRSVQQFIMQAMKRGASFRFASKEGSTRIFWHDGQFIRSDEGEFPTNEQFTEEAEFLVALRQFCDVYITRNAGSDTLSEFDSWKLIRRLLRE